MAPWEAPPGRKPVPAARLPGISALPAWLAGQVRRAARWRRGSAARRGLLAGAGFAVLLASVVVPVATWPTASPSPVSPEVTSLSLSGVDPQVVADSAVAMAAWDHLDHPDVEPLGLAPMATGEDGGRVNEAVDADPLAPAIATQPVATTDFGLVGVTSDAPLDPSTRVLVRVREDGDWGTWQPLRITEHGPDPGSPEAVGARYGTEPLLVDSADGVQVRVDTPGGEVPANPQVLLVDNPVVAADANLPAPQDPAIHLPVSTVAAATATAPVPTIITREQWGADESLRSAGPRYSPTIKVAFVHHTTSTNDYSPEDAAQQVRNLYGWYVKGLRYSDMAYNFLVDRYGRLYEGRAGGMGQAVIGGHTAGFNNDTFAISAIGNFQKLNPPPEQVAAIDQSVASLLAWKLSLNHRNPNGTQVLTSDSAAGTSKYQPGQQATALVIGGHKDIGSTACPGQFLEAQLPTIRSLATSMMGATIYDPQASAPAWGTPDPMTITTTSTAPIAWTLSISSRCGALVRTISGQQDAAGPLSIAWDKKDANGNPVPPGTYVLSLTGNAGSDAIYPWNGAGVITSAPGAPADPCGPPESFTIVGAGYGHGIGMSQWGAYGMAQEGADANAILSHYYTGSTVGPVQDDMDVRVNLKYAVATAQMRAEPLDGGPGGIEVTVGPTVVTGGPADTFAFSVVGSSVGVQRITGGAATDLGSAPAVQVRWAGTRNPGTAPGGPTVLNLVSGQAALDSPGHRYRYGSMEVTPTTTSAGIRLNVVNILRLHDEYLYGLSEVSSSWPKAAMQAQAIAARSYALSKMAKSGIRKQCACHIDDGDGPFGDQSFVGWSKENGPKGGRWAKAVAETSASETSGQAVLVGGQPITAYYSSSTGGATNSAKDIWGGDVPYAVSVDDHWSLVKENPNRSWTVTAPQASVAKAFGVPGVWKLAIVARHGSGAAASVQATLSDGSTRTLAGDELRSALGLKSSYLTSIDGAAGAQAAAPGGAAAGSAAGSAAEEAGAPGASAGTAVLRVSLKVGPSVSPKPGSRLVFSGKVRPKKGAKGLRVERQRLDDGVWTTVAKTRTNAKGRFTFVVKQATPAGATYQYRVIVTRKGAILGTSDQATVTIAGKKGSKDTGKPKDTGASGRGRA